MHPEMLKQLVQLLIQRQGQYQPQQAPIGLTGMDPRMMQDPRFDVQTGVLSRGQFAGKPFIASGPEGTGMVAESTMNPNIDVKYLADVDDETLKNDMWAVTAGGKKGTSEGDTSTPWFIQNSKDIVGNSKQITPQMLDLLRGRLLQQRYGEIRQTHPGKGGYTPEGLRY